jgi:hypothetical protein
MLQHTPSSPGSRWSTLAFHCAFDSRLIAPPTALYPIFSLSEGMYLGWANTWHKSVCLLSACLDVCLVNDIISPFKDSRMTGWMGKRVKGSKMVQKGWKVKRSKGKMVKIPTTQKVRQHKVWRVHKVGRNCISGLVDLDHLTDIRGLGSD